MDIKPPSNVSQPPVTASPAVGTQSSLENSLPANWKVDQLIQAVITRITDKQLFLDIQGIKANTTKPAITNLQTGDIFKLQIEQLKPLPQFRIVGLQKAANNNLIAQHLKNLITRETSSEPLFKNITFVATRPALRPSPLSANINSAVREIFRQIPSPFNLKTAEQVKTHIQNSGIFVESKIKNNILPALQTSQASHKLNTKTNLNAQLNQDIGAQLHRLANLIKTQLHLTNTTANTTAPLTKNSLQPPAQQIPPSVTSDNKTAASAQRNVPGGVTAEQASLQSITLREEAMLTFLRQVESSLTHLQQTQLQNLNESQAGRPMWLMELPIKDGQDIDQFELRITEEETSQTEAEAKKIWSVTLAFNLSGLGLVKSQIKLQGDFVSAHFFSENPQTLALFQKNIDFLRGRLRYNGLNVGNIECAQKDLTTKEPPTNSPRLDERI